MPYASPNLSGRLRPFFAALALLPAALSAASQIHLSPTGNDTNPGTTALPVATPQGAQVRVRTLIQAGLTDAVEVIFAAGTYVMDAPLELQPEDSGTAAFPITWKAATGAEVILSGGKQITGTWTNSGDGIWYTDLAGIGLAASQWNFRQLFVNGSRATRARYPNVTASNPLLYATGGAMDYLTITPALVKSSWGTAADAQINVVPQSRFFNQWNTVTAVNTSTGRIDIADSERHRLIDSGSWFWIEGVQAELDEPGEWFLNPTTGRLYYMPPVGVDPNTQTIVAPFLNRIVNAKGAVNTGTHVANVHFDGLKFLHTSFTLGQIEARVHTDAAIMFENTNNSSVRNCHFENIGGYALWLHLDSQRNVFDHNTVQYSGGGGVLLTGARFAYMDDSKIYTPGEAAAKVAPILNEITRNTVGHCGKIRYYGGGVHLDSRPFGMTMAPGNHIAHNHFNDLSRNGVFAFRNQGGNVIEYNHIHNAMQTTIDGAAIHFATMNTLNAPNYILNNWLYDIWGYNQNSSGIPNRTLASGVFLDWDTSTTTVKDNWIYNCPSGSVKVIFGGNRNVVQSGNQFSSTAITPPFVAEVGPAGTATNGINMETNKFTGSIISYQDTTHFAKTGTWTEETAIGIVNLFEFKFLAGTAAVPSQATYTLPITENGYYQISLLYKPGSNRASNVPITIDHADGISNVTWNMQQGSTYGFAVPVGTYRFVASETNTVTLATTGTNGKVIADAVAFVKVKDGQTPPSRFIGKISQGIPQRVVLYGTSLTATGAWVSQLQTAVEEIYPGMVTWINSGGSGKASDWGLANLQTKVIDQHPDTVFIEFSMNDAATTLNIPRPQALANLTSMVNAIRSAFPDCEIILQLMNPVDHRDGDTYSPRPELALYQQDYRDFAASNGLRCIDHMPAFQALLDEGSDAYRGFVPDGVHPSAEGFARYMTPVLCQAIDALGVGQNQPTPTVRLRMDNGRAAEPATPGGAARASSLIVWRSGPTQTALTVSLNFTGGSAMSGVDYAVLPTSITIPAGQSSAAVDLLPLDDLLTEGDETFKVSLVPAAGYSTDYPNKASMVIADRVAPHPPPTGRTTLIEENFGGSGSALHGSSADTFASAITTAGGSATWAAGSGFLQNGAVSGSNAAAYLNLGSYINNAKNTANGKFDLTMTISETSGTWISLGFGAENMPNTTKNFTNSGTGTATTTGLGTIIYRAQTGIIAPSANGELDMFGGSNNTNAIDGPDGNTGFRTLTATLDFTPAGGYNGTNHFGTVTWSDRVLGIIGSYTYNSNRNLGSILVSNAAGSSGTISALSLSQVMAGTTTSYADWLATNAPATGFITDSDNDGLPNGVENILGSDPSTHNAGLTRVSSTATSAVFKHQLNPDIASDVTYGYQWSTDLVNWHVSGATNSGGTSATITPSTPDANQVVTVIITITGGPSAKLFGRLEATQSP